MLLRCFRPAAFAALASFCVLAGCDDAPAEKTDAASGAPNAATGPKLANLGSEMVAAVSSGKTATIISVHFVLGAPPTVGKPLPVEIAIVPHRKFISVRAHFEPHDGLTLTSGGVYGPKEDAQAENVLKHELILTPENEGVFMVTAVVDTEGDEGSVTRVFSIPVFVAPAQGAATAATERTMAPVAKKPATN